MSCKLCQREGGGKRTAGEKKGPHRSGLSHAERMYRTRDVLHLKSKESRRENTCQKCVEEGLGMEEANSVVDG